MKVKNGGDYFLERFGDIYDEITKTLPPNLDFVYLTFIETKKKKKIPYFFHPLSLVTTNLLSVSMSLFLF